MIQQCKHKSWWCFPYNWLVSCKHPGSKNEKLCMYVAIVCESVREEKTFFAHKQNNNNNSHNNEIWHNTSIGFPFPLWRLKFTTLFFNIFNICFLFFSGEPQDELVHYLCPGPGHGVLGDALPGQELSQNPHLQAGNQDQAQELHGAARHSKGLHSHYCRYT